MAVVTLVILIFAEPIIRIFNFEPQERIQLRKRVVTEDYCSVFIFTELEMGMIQR
jgi:hypothetical protein